MKHFQAGIAVEKKSDNSPVTQADIESDNFISSELKKLTPEIPVISEEGELNNIDTTCHTYWLVDPIDGTRSFIRNEPEFTVNIGLIAENKPVLGSIFAPAMGILWFTAKDGKAYRFDASKINRQIHVSKPVPEGEGMRVIASKEHRNKLTEEYVNRLNVKEFIQTASSYKFCLMAEGAADIYPRFSNTMQWDTAAGQAILEAAGGSVVKADGTPFTYDLSQGKEGLKNQHFIAKNH